MLVKSFSWGGTSCIGKSLEGEKWLGFYPQLCPAEKGWIYRLGVSWVPDSCCRWAWARRAWSLQEPMARGAPGPGQLSAWCQLNLPSCPTRNPSQLPKAGVLWKSDGWWLPKARSHVHHGTGRRGRCSAMEKHLQGHRGWFPPCPSSWATLMSRQDAILTGGLKCR